MIRSLRRALVVALVLAVVVPAGAANQVRGKVVKLHDGDSFELLRGDRTTVGVRVFGVDCPERGQPWGARAKSFSAGLIGNATVVVVVKDVDRYGRMVGDVVLADGRHLSRELLRAGLAWHYRRYDDDPELEQLEAAARAARRGLWSEPHPVAPWTYRSGRRARR